MGSTGVEDSLGDEKCHDLSQGRVILPASVQDVFHHFSQLIHFSLYFKYVTLILGYIIILPNCHPPLLAIYLHHSYLIPANPII